MALILMGFAMLVYAVLLTGFVARRLDQQGRPSSEVWWRLPQSPTVWFGIVLIVAAMNTAAGGALMLVVLAVAVFQVVNGVRAFPQMWRRIGDAAAWRGQSKG